MGICSDPLYSATYRQRTDKIVWQQQHRTSCPGINSWSNHICNTLGTSDSSYHKKDVNGKVTEKDAHGTD